jgi:hypothetical protein
MSTKYDINTYPEYYQVEDSDTEAGNLKLTEEKKATYVNSHPYSDEFFQPQCIFTKEKNNLSFFNSDSTNRKYKSINKNMKQINYDSDVIKKKNTSNPSNYAEEQFSYNYTNTEENNNNSNNDAPLKERICLDNLLHQKSIQLPKRTIKAYQNQFDVEKSDNFNVLSYRPEEYESDNIKTDANSKIIQIFKKEDAGELFYPSKRAISPPNPNSNNSTEQNHKLLSYQTPTLKFQSFFGSFMRPKHVKNNSQNKSSSKIKRNQLEDFNIDKLIEIGDSNNNKLEKFLSFGKKIKSIKNKNKLNNKNKSILHNLHYYSENEKIPKKIKLKDFLNQNHKKENLTEILKIAPNNANDANNKKIMQKKFIYHGQIKRKRNIKNTKTYNKQSIDCCNQKRIIDDIDKNLNVNDTKKQMNNYNTNNIEKNINRSIKFKKINSKPNSKGKEIFSIKNIANPTFHEINPNKGLPNNKIDLNLIDNKKYSLINNPKKNSNLNKSNYITMINKDNKNNKDNKIQKDISKKIILTETDRNMKNKNIYQRIKPTIQTASNNPVIYEANNNNKRITKNNTTNKILQSFKKMPDKNFKIKNYYGYDERHNLEGTINNHSYYVSVYSRQQANKKNSSIEKIN